MAAKASRIRRRAHRRRVETDKPRDSMETYDMISTRARRGIVTVLTMIVAAYTSLAPATSHAQSSDTPVSNLIVEVKEVLDQVNSAALDSLPSLSRATLNLKSVLKKESGGKFSLWVVSFGKKVSEEVVQEVSLDLAPPPRSPERTSPNDREDTIDISTALAEAIIAAAEAVDQAQLGSQLGLRKLTAAVRFGVSTDGGGSLQLQILPLTIDVSGDVDRGAVQEIVVEFGN